MANVELDSEIVAKLQSAFKVSQKDIFTLLDFFNTQLKPRAAIIGRRLGPRWDQRAADLEGCARSWYAGTLW